MVAPPAWQRLSASEQSRRAYFCCYSFVPIQRCEPRHGDARARHPGGNVSSFAPRSASVITVYCGMGQRQRGTGARAVAPSTAISRHCQLPSLAGKFKGGIKGRAHTQLPRPLPRIAQRNVIGALYSIAVRPADWAAEPGTTHARPRCIVGVWKLEETQIAKKELYWVAIDSRHARARCAASCNCSLQHGYHGLASCCSAALPGPDAAMKCLCTGTQRPSQAVPGGAAGTARAPIMQRNLRARRARSRSARF